jgi:dsRNA-specific ribonuclease
VHAGPYKKNGEGSSIKTAEKEAARKLLFKLNNNKNFI